ncbi:MAG: transketolase family protein [Candidatus Wolfebacteria bacterium]|nr:transketolase family protein [Candidatus Wolfebacteria bacterium]
MLNKEIHLSSKIFENHREKALRDGFGEGLVELGEENKDVVVLCADLKESTRCHWFADKFPERFFEVGVAEQNMATIAAGLGVAGKIPFISSYAVFSPGRNWEQIRTTIAYNDSNVKIAGHHAGISTGADGATHQATEDIATMRAMSNMKVIVPLDYEEAKKATVAAAKIWGPVYIRLAREKTPEITTEKTRFVPGKSYVLWESKKPQAVIIGAGPLLYNALLAAKKLEKEKIGVVVLNSHTIKPLDENKIVELAKKYRAVVTVEEHTIIGGLGSAVAETLAKHAPTAMEFVGIQDVFGQSGEPKELIEKYELGVDDIIKATKRAIRRK